jgi:hypothetical protein
MTPHENGLQAAIRMRLDRLLIGELRGAEAFVFLQAINTGHPGSLTTDHANSAHSAYERLALIESGAGRNLSNPWAGDFTRSCLARFSVMADKQFMDYMSRDMIQPHEKRVLVLLDEFESLGKLENALTVATVLGGYGIPTWFFVQSLRSIDNIYTREGRQTLVNAARAQVFFGSQDPEDQRFVSQLLGNGWMW